MKLFFIVFKVQSSSNIWGWLYYFLKVFLDVWIVLNGTFHIYRQCFLIYLFTKPFYLFTQQAKKNNIFHCKFSILLCFFYLTYTNDKPCPSFSCKSFVPVNKLRKYVNTYPRGLDEVINNFLCHLGKITHINGSTNEITFSYEFVNIFISPGSKSSRRHIYFVIFDTFYSYDLIYWLFLSFRVIFRNAMADFKTAKLTRKTLRLYAFICSVLFFICGKGGGIFHSLKFLLFRFLKISF